ncbi:MULTISPECIES: enoyl-CoA hydratase/isomerase family protein [Desulfococcus]|uniref:Enoyl-CoA hydratase domain-containing protein 3, mitochondrial n=1 Tax=Desulfococcus multivorans DSM 2059 TaxID=1121405 RepID=S7UMY0_DESML|nr:enoyl-CoA hydratase-related protein [Desulfococcus multivorans]AOY58664.1 short chain enoyl-CoA hydratase [Desulfococcus multivorans]AQV00954.1 enoyl-CoA hydratase [Desulfococcus multivorans]EPR35319.1 Enoyl-CoA hydratase/isomerase [Desulfococcus multivorans DSM 2059]SJZ45900.1 short chain enoyl-CoA hydratase [Desulfococcus multivorans DSM 2059]
MAFETVILNRDGDIGMITLNRPEQFNTFSSQMAREMNAALAELDADESIRVVIVKGAGKVFSTGIDITEYPGKTATEYHEWISLMEKMHAVIAGMKKPVIAMAHKYAVANGAGLVFAADFAVISDDTQIGTTAINVGLLCTGPIIPIADRLGKKKTMEMLLSGDMINAREAEALGLVNKVVPADKLEEETLALARKLADKSPTAVRMGKEFYYKMQEMPFSRRFTYNAELFARLCTTEDAREGISAFLEKRKPVWKGK